MKIFILIAFISLLASCQKEFNAPVVEVIVQPATPEISSIVITNGTHGDYDSIVYRYFTDRTFEVHYTSSGDSTLRNYYYDSEGRLSKLEDEKAIYYTNNDIAKKINFIYNNAGELTETSTDFTKVSGMKAYYNNISSADTKSIIVYDTLYKGSSYNLDWANRIIYNTLNSDNNILYDSSNYFSYTSGLVKTVVSAYTYDVNKDVTSINKFTYQDSELSEWGTTTVIRDKPAPLFEALRKKLYRNLATWYQTSSAMQDDSYKLFPLSGGMYKSIKYKGFSVTGVTTLQDVIRDYIFENIYNNDVLINSQVTYNMSGQGNTNYTYQIHYYYR